MQDYEWLIGIRMDWLIDWYKDWLIFRQGSKWYKFDDGDVTEVFMQDDEELKNQCWGGEYLSEVSTVYN